MSIRPKPAITRTDLPSVVELNRQSIRLLSDALAHLKAVDAKGHETRKRIAEFLGVSDGDVGADE